MKLVQTLQVRDEADIVDTQIAYHLNAGVDFVIATDHDSRDGTTDILESYVRDGYLRRIPESGTVRESTWRTRMARLAAIEHGADWVIHTDADEFWIPRAATLRDSLAAVPQTLGIVWGLSRPFAPRSGDERHFSERMTVRVSLQAALNDPTSPYRPHAKVGHRADPTVVVRHGGHSAASSRLRPLTGWYVAEVFHFPYRTQAQYERKGLRGVQAGGYTPLGQYVRASQASQAGRASESYERLLVDDETLARGVAAGSLVVDTRLRDTVRTLNSNFAHSSGARPRLEPPGLTAATPVIAQVGTGTTELDRALVAEAAALREADVVRLARDVDGLRGRLSRVEGRSRGRTDSLG